MFRLIKAMVAIALLVGLMPMALRAEEGAAPSSDMPKTARVRMTTTLGDIVLELDAEKAPITTANFLEYVAAGFYEGTVFHRVMPGFMIQGGGYTPEIDEKEEGLRDPIKNESKNGLKNVTGTISMARLSAPDTATAQFFINVVDNPSLDDNSAQGRPGYAVFGKVVEGMDTVEKIRDTETIEHPKYPGGKVVPKEAVVIKKVTQEGGMSVEQARAMVAAAAEKRAAAEAEAKKEAEKMMTDKIAALEKEHGATFRTTDSGLKIMTVRAGEGDRMPKPTDTVEVHYRGTLMDGKEFDSSYKRNKTIEFPLNRVIKGWTEGVGMMKPGEKAILVIPSDLAYGKGGVPGTIPPDATLIFEVELVSIK